MAVDVTFYNLSKRINSTKQPTGTGNTISCNLRDGSDKYNPNIEIRGINVTGYNYMFIPLFNRYYYIDKCTWSAEQQFWLVSGSVDVLATFKNTILNSVQMIVRTGLVAAEDFTIADDFAITQGKPLRTINPISDNFFPTLETSVYDCSVICNIAGQGFVVMDMLNYTNMLRNFFAQNDPITMEYWTQDIARQIINPASHFISQTMFPIKTNVLQNGSFNPRIGWYEVPNVTCGWLLRTFLEYSTTVGIQFHPQADNNPDHYLNYPPYTTRNLYMGGFGQVALDNNRCIAGTNLTMTLTIDLLAGGAKLKVTNVNGQVVGYSVAQMGTNVAMASRNPINVVSLAGQALLGGAVGGVMGLAGGAMHAISSLQNAGSAITSGSTGGTGGWVDFRGSVLCSDFKTIKKSSRFRQGRPYYQEDSLSNHQGNYVMCANPSVQINGSKAELTDIYNYMQGGIHLE